MTFEKVDNVNSGVFDIEKKKNGFLFSFFLIHDEQNILVSV